MNGESAEPVADVPFLVTASELRQRKIERRLQRLNWPSRAEAIRRLVELGLKL